jgi:hypothetical protein
MDVMWEYTDLVEALRHNEAAMASEGVPEYR